jgi:hypothetical protein
MKKGVVLTGVIGVLVALPWGAAVTATADEETAVVTVGEPVVSPVSTPNTPSNVVLVARPAPVPEAPSNMVMVLAPFVESFGWEETQDDGRRLLEESGYRYGLAVKMQQYPRLAPFLSGGMSAKLYGGQVDYDGETTGTAEPVPVTTETAYLGADLTLDGGVRITPHRRVWLDLFAAGCLATWRRDIHDAGDVRGYVEKWFNVHGRAGLGVTCKFPLGFSGFSRLGCMIPLYTENSIDLSNVGLVGIVDLKPKQRFTPFAEAGVAWGPLFAGAFYERMDFDRSDTVTKTIVVFPYVMQMEFWQPESLGQRWGLQIGLGGVF